uniref:CDP-diacylglycerol--glycerol-3-phosphate 3-phosphatidyltransferase n=1 Tax=Angiostrongylus cantonensis TaxID=6313 RepID=A0A158P9N6_ANGCA
MEYELPKSRAIRISAGNVKLLKSPAEFYEFLLTRSRSATQRIVLSTLYLGNGTLEQALVESIDSNLKERGNLQVYLYHTPKLRGLLRHILPERANEIIGLQHMKIYVFDDTVLLTGANLSTSYFVNRQDRYVVFKNCKELADFFHGVVAAVGKCSFQLSDRGSIELNPACSVHPFEGCFADYRALLRSCIDKVIAALPDQELLPHSLSDTVVYPLLQMGPFEYNEEYNLLIGLFSLQYEKLMFTEGKYSMDIITAAPKANGFFGATGTSGYIPSIYSRISESVLQLKKRYNRSNVNLYEYYRDGWTFHAKGLWVETATETASLMGSSNFGYRSVHRDLEAQVLLVTSNEHLRDQLKEERNRLFDFASILDEVTLRRTDHHIPMVVRMITRIIRNLF